MSLNKSSPSRRMASCGFVSSRCSTRRTLFSFSIVLCALIGLCSGESKQCSSLLNTPGRTWPSGDVIIEHGQPLSIYCILDKTLVDATYPGKTSSDLVFTHNNKEIESEYIHVINETTIELRVEKPEPSNGMYYCSLKVDKDDSKLVCLNYVAIGLKPKAPENFNCVSQNWDNLTCTWDPIEHYVKTDHTLQYTLGTSRVFSRFVFSCPVDDKRNTCFWDISTTPQYRSVHEFYKFTMKVSNVFGSIDVVYVFDHFANVISGKPVDLSVVNKTSESALLHWKLPSPMSVFPPGLDHRVMYRSQWDSEEKDWKVATLQSASGPMELYYNLTGLEFANTVYDVRVSIKSTKATEEDKWSKFSELQFRTEAILPAKPPRTDIGSFEIVEKTADRDVYLYLQEIPAQSENGDNFVYQITQVEEDGKKSELLPKEVTSSYAKFKGVSFKSSRFEIVSKNVVGASKDKSSIVVPSRAEAPQEPLAFTKIAHDGGLYELLWKSPVNSADVADYTIFWCENQRDRPYQCSGYLDFVHVSKDTRAYNVTTDPKKVYQFAISANTAVASSGMVWASCTVLLEKALGKFKNVWIKSAGVDSIELALKPDCSDGSGIIESYNIYYCPTISAENLECQEGSTLKKTISADPHTIDGSIDGLQLDTNYRITVTVSTKHGESLHSDPLYEATNSTPHDVFL